MYEREVNEYIPSLGQDEPHEPVKLGVFPDWKEPSDRAAGPRA
jgi:hypothetical protein